MNPSRRLVHLSISANGAELRTGELHGIQYIIAPCISKIGNNVEWPINAPTPELIPASVLSLATGSRNNRPVVMGHPQAEDGTYISANDPEILAKYCFGHVFSAVFEDNKIKCEMWLDPIKAKQVGPDAERVIERLQNGEMIEVSEGDYVITEKQEGEWNGKKYGAVWIACWADHLAALAENQRGACSIDDGCGALRTSQGIDADSASNIRVATVLDVSALSQARRPTFTGTETTTWSKPTFADYIRYLFNGDAPPTSVSKCSSELKRSISAHSLLGDPEATNFQDLTYFPVVNPATGYLNENALRAVLRTSESESLSLSALTSAKEMSTRLLNSEFSANLETSEAKMKDKKKDNPFKKIIASMTDALKAAMSNNELRGKLYKALSSMEPGISYVYDEDLDAKTVLYCVVVRYGEYYDSGEYEYHFYQRTFNLDASGNVSIIGNAVEVEWFEGWRPINKTETELSAAAESTASCGCHKGDSNMNRVEVIKRLSGLSQFAGSVKALESMSDEALASLDKVYATGDQGTQGDQGTDKDAGNPGSGNSSTNTPASPATNPPATPAPASTPAPTAPTQTVSLSQDEYARIKAASDAFASQQAAAKSTLVASLKTAQSEFTEAELQAMEVADLEKLARITKVPQGNFVGLPVPTDSGGKTLRPLPDTWGLGKKAAGA